MISLRYKINSFVIYTLLISVPLLIQSINTFKNQADTPTNLKIILNNSTRKSNFDYNIKNDNHLNFSKYESDGNFSALLLVDSSLIGIGNYFHNKNDAVNRFNSWCKPFENKLSVNLNFPIIKTFTPGINDSLWDTMDNLCDNIPWKKTFSRKDPNLSANGYDILVIYQKSYNSGNNHVNAIFGNALIISHEQPMTWTTKQLIFIHELGHLFGGEHDEEGNVPSDWYGSAARSIMDYGDIAWMRVFGFNTNDLPIDDHNLHIMTLENQTDEFGFPTNANRFDFNDPDQDQIPNWFEYKFGLNATKDDSKDDLDKDEVNNFEEWKIGTHPNLNDSDNDFYPDGFEVTHGTSPLDKYSYPIISEPILFPLNNTLTNVRVNETFTIKWWGYSEYPYHYKVKKNGSVISQDEWDGKSIIFLGYLPNVGLYNLSCSVYDLFGRSISSSILISVLNPRRISLNPFIPTLAIFIFIILRRIFK